ncbi:hypothetical protein KJ691_00720 [bacterium]|nr:hypothetical protein [bacterium]
MLIYGHRFIPSIHFYHIADIDSIQNTPPSSVIYLPFTEDNLDIITHANQNSVPFALKVKEVTQILYASSFNASFIVVPRELASTAQKIANNYLFDAKILVSIKDEDEIEDLAVLGVDGVIFTNAIIKINS